MRIRLLLLILLFYSQSGPISAEDEPVIAVSSNFYPAMEEISRHYTVLTGEKIRLASGASGTLTHQIELGAPFELFLSADESYVKGLHARGFTRDEGKIYANGQLVLFISHAIDIPPPGTVDTILRNMDLTHSSRIALANPALAPYGRAAREVLERYDLWQEDNGKLILAENVGQTAQFARTGAVELAFLPLSLARTGGLREQGLILTVPHDWYKPIHQRMVLLNHASQTANNLYHYISGETARQIIEQYGYMAPERER